MYCIVLFFFFQAEDGIRDIGVTGVQTCALPICPRRPAPAAVGTRRRPRWPGPARPRAPPAGPGRSGERRGGEEGRSRGAPDHLKKKKKANKEQLQYEQL